MNFSIESKFAGNVLLFGAELAKNPQMKQNFIIALKNLVPKPDPANPGNMEIETFFKAMSGDDLISTLKTINDYIQNPQKLSGVVKVEFLNYLEKVAMIIKNTANMIVDKNGKSFASLNPNFMSQLDQIKTIVANKIKVGGKKGKNKRRSIPKLPTKRGGGCGCSKSIMNGGAVVKYLL